MIKLSLIFLTIIVSGCASYANLISDKDDVWINYHTIISDNVMYCVANKMKVGALPVCYEPEIKKLDADRRKPFYQEKSDK